MKKNKKFIFIIVACILLLFFIITMINSWYKLYSQKKIAANYYKEAIKYFDEATLLHLSKNDIIREKALLSKAEELFMKVGTGTPFHFDAQTKLNRIKFMKMELLKREEEKIWSGYK